MARRRRNKIIPDGEFSATIESLSHDGRGIAHINGKTTFIFNALPGEAVQFRYTQCHGKFDEGAATTITNPSADRVDPLCQHFSICGGCSLQHLNAKTQIATKQQSLLEQLQHLGKVQPQTVLPPLTGPEFGYRHKARLGVRFVIKKDIVLVGFRERQSNYLAEITECEVLHPSVGKRIMALRELMQQLDAYRDIAQIEVAIGEDTTALVLRNLVELNSNDQEKLINFAQEHHLWLYLQPGNADSVTKLYPNDDQLLLHYSLPQYNLRFNFHPLDFTQVNPVLNRDMIPLALQLLDLQASDNVLDLFCGLGNFSLPMATIAKTVVGVEGSEQMVQRAYFNAEQNNLTNCEFYAANLMADCSNADWAQRQYDKILLDPPRSGAIEILPVVAQMAANTIVYVSCNPATLARDAGELVNKYGYTLISAGVMDMFPHTTHVESIALFRV